MTQTALELPHRGTRALRLLHVIHTLDPLAGGTVSAAQSVCKALAARGHDVALLAAGPIRTELAAPYRTSIFPTEFSAMSVSVGLWKALNRMPSPDLVHLHMLYRFPQAAAANFCRHRKIPYCMQPHGSLEPMLFHKRERRFLKRTYERLVEMRNLRRAAGIIYTADGERDAADFLHLPPPAFVVPNALDLSEFDDAPVGEFRKAHGLEDKTIISWMGRLVPVKGLDILCRAFAGVALSHPSTMLVLIGPDTEGYAARLRHQISELGVDSQRIVFAGMLQGRAKIAALQDCDVFVLPSYTENFGLAAVEAMALGRPVIISEGVKIASDIAAAGAGLVTVPESAELTRAIVTMLDDEAMRQRMGKAAKIKALSFSEETVAVGLEDAYWKMIGS